MNYDEQITQRIHKLLNLADDDAAAKGEVENALRFARRLMLQHQITEDDLKKSKPSDMHEKAADQDVTQMEYGKSSTFTHGRGLSDWETQLAWAVAELVGSVKWYFRNNQQKKTARDTVVLNRKGEPKKATRLTFYGPAAEAATAASLYGEWVETIAAMARLKWGGALRGDGRCYAEGFVSGIRAMQEDMLQEERDQIAAGTAVVLLRATDLMKRKRDHASTWLSQCGVSLGRARNYGNQGRSENATARSDGKSDGRKSGFSHKRQGRIG